MVTRIYVVIHGEERRLIDAGSAAQAIRHCVKNKYQAKPAGPKEIATLLGSGMSVERASEEASGKTTGTDTPVSAD